ncbi:MAG: hypothetical protein E6I24_04530 [Chloroflexi bacterium]|nr:MAG: hypothetical protein E6I24_04530 [Chloroflexota bacterium]
MHAAFSLTNADLWAPQSPALYVLQVQVFWQERLVDQIFETFGLRRIAVDSTAPRLLLNGDPVAYAGVALHDERVYPAVKGEPRGGPVVTPDDILILLDKANASHIQLIRADHHPANPLLLMLADRLGYAIWEEIPLYHYTPATFAIAMDRGIPQQMLSEMDLRDMNHPSVLFHGLANESTGGIEREQALATLHNLDRSVDGTRLTGQAAYGNQPDDNTSRPLDVAGYTTYYGVFYGPDAGPGSTPFRLPTPPSPKSRSSSWSTDDGRTAWPTKRSSAGSWPTPMRRRPRTWTRTAAAFWRGPSGGRSTTTGPSGPEARSSTLGYTNRTVIHDPPACKPPPSLAAEPGRAPDRGSFRWPPASHVNRPREALPSSGISATR